MPDEIKTPPAPVVDNAPTPVMSPAEKANIDRWLLVYDGIVTPTLMENLIAYGYVYDGVLDVKIAMDIKNNIVIYTLLVTSKLYKTYLRYKQALNKYAGSKSIWGKFKLLRLLKKASDLNIEFNINKCVNDYLPPVKLSDGKMQSFTVKVEFVVQPYLLSKIFRWLGIK